jgi:phage tail sheath protein FI
MAPWVKVPGITLGTTRTVPPSAIVAGLIARNDGAEVNQNVPSAGDLGISRWAIDLSQTPWSDADRQTLNTSSISVIRDIYNSIRMYGWRTLVDPVTQPSWINFGNSRLHMTIAAEGHAVGERFVFDQLDGQGITINQFGAELTAILMPLFEAGALYGTTPEEAFFVDVGQQVNTPETIATNTLKAVISVRMSPFGELVQIEIVKVPVTEAVV